jgi:hypothetical protein
MSLHLGNILEEIVLGEQIVTEFKATKTAPAGTPLTLPTIHRAKIDGAHYDVDITLTKRD